MKRYTGEPLRAGFRVSVVANDALGNFVVSTPLLQMLRAAGSGRVDYYGGHRTWELIVASDLVDRGFPLFGTEPSEAIRGLEPGADLVVNLENTPLAKVAAGVLAGREGWVCGPCIGTEGRGDLPFPDDPRGRLWADTDWTSEDLLLRYPFLETPFIGEIFCRLAYLDGPVPNYRVPVQAPAVPVPDVLVAMGASLPDKLWTPEGWRAVLGWLRDRGMSVGLLGAKPAAQTKYWEGSGTEETLVSEGLVEDLRGRFSLPEVAGALARARLVVTLDNGILHLAAAARAPTIGLFRNGIHRLWAPPNPGLMVLVPPAGRPVSDIEPSAVLEVLEGAAAGAP